MSEYSCQCNQSDEKIQKVLCQCKPSDENIKQKSEEKCDSHGNDESLILALHKNQCKFDCKKFLLKYLSKPLVSGLREIVLRKPTDPIDFLGRWLLHYRDCEKRAKELEEFEAELHIYRESLRVLDRDDSSLGSYLNRGEQEFSSDDNQ